MPQKKVPAHDAEAGCWLITLLCEDAGRRTHTISAAAYPREVSGRLRFFRRLPLKRVMPPEAPDVLGVALMGFRRASFLSFVPLVSDAVGGIR